MAITSLHSNFTIGPGSGNLAALILAMLIFYVMGYNLLMTAVDLVSGTRQNINHCRYGGYLGQLSRIVDEWSGLST